MRSTPATTRKPAVRRALVSAAAAMAFGGLAWAAADPGFRPVQPALFGGSPAFATAWGDYDGDGDLDVVVGFKSGALRLYRNDHGAFTDATPESWRALRGQEVRGLTWGDYDADGRIDLYVNTRPRKFLFHNLGGGTFEEVGQALGVDAPGANARQASFIDYDNDGDLDLFMADRNGPNRLFRNEGGRFVDVAAQVGLADRRKTVGACWFDMDGDGDLDLFIANQNGDTDGFFRNDGGHFTDVAPQLGMDSPGRTTDEGGVACAVGDYDNDGDLDLFVASYGVSRLYRNDGQGRFTEVAARLGVAVKGHMVAAAWGDYDNDGRLDLFVAGYTGEGETAQPDDHLFRNTAAGFVEVLTRGHPLNAADHGVQWVDYDGDGALDLSLAQGYPKGGRASMFRNTLPRAQGRRAVEVDVRDAAGRATRAGAEVRVYDRKGRLLGVRMASTGDGYDSQSQTAVHFGLPKAEPVTVEATFLTAAGRKTVRLAGVVPGAAVQIRQPK